LGYFNLLIGINNRNFRLFFFFLRHIFPKIEANLFYYRDSNQNEVDVVLPVADRLIPIEIKSSQTFNKNFLKGLNYFADIANNSVDSGFVIYAGQTEQHVDQFQLLNFLNTYQVVESRY